MDKREKSTYIGLVMSRRQRAALDERIADLECNRSHFMRTAIKRLMAHPDEEIAGYLRENSKNSLDNQLKG